MSYLRRRPLPLLGGLLLLVTLCAVLLTNAGAPATARSSDPGALVVGAPPKVAGAKPTIVLVHGAWADSTGWAAEISALRAKGYDTVTVANPLRGLTSDAAYVRSVVDTIPGPVVLVGHSYGGAVITGAATGASNVAALVYIAAFVPDEGEPVGQLTQLNPGSLVTDSALVVRPLPGGAGVDLYLREGIFRKAFAGDLPRSTTRLMWATQRPLASAAFSEPSGPAAWHTIPSWYLLATDDNTIPPKTQKFMAKRAGATIDRVKSSHVAMQARPEATTALILAAVDAVD